MIKFYLKSRCYSKVNFKGKFPIIYAAPCTYNGFSFVYMFIKKKNTILEF